MSHFDWARFEESLFEELVLGLRGLAKEGRDHPFYALALWHVYRELDRTLSLPSLAAAIEDGSHPERGDLWGVRYSPADFAYTMVELREDECLALERALTAEATQSTQAQFRATDTRYTELLVRVTARLRDAAPQILRVTDDFICFSFEPALGHAHAARTIEPTLFAQLFPRQIDDDAQHAAADALPLAERAAFLVTRFGEHQDVSGEDAQRDLLEIGAPALDALVPALSDLKTGWTAAMVIGQIGVSRPDVIEALRANAAKHLWFAKALGRLSDHAWLAQQAPDIAGHGLCAPLLAIGAGRDLQALDYGPIETYLEGASDEARTPIESELEPGRSYISIDATGVDEALRGLSSPHSVVRWHAASLLGHRGLGPEVATRVLTSLVGRLEDENPLVRRLAVLSIHRWQALADPYRGQIAGLRDDPDETVRRIVEYVLSDTRS